MKNLAQLSTQLLFASFILAIFLPSGSDAFVAPSWSTTAHASRWQLSPLSFAPSPFSSQASVCKHGILFPPSSPQRLRHAQRAEPLYMAAKRKAAKSVSGKLMPAVQGVMSCATKVLATLFVELKQLSKIQALLFVAIFWIGLTIGRSPSAIGGMALKRFQEASEIPSAFFGPSAPLLRGRVTSCSDGDTIRFLHVPNRFSANKLEKGQTQTEYCLPIRLCSMDTPETAKFGKPGQPFGQEAKEYLQKLLDQKMIKIRLLQKDQYGRAVAEVYAPNGKGCDELMLKKGFAEVYLGGGAVYGPLGKDKYLAFEAQAKKKKLGIWSTGKRESAAEFKKRTKK
ncbi:unnamed protein product [Cylindrotheca closterium]|uniref:TNase-like domain-containing protein n=1 Tax=Cylindrotheca closterium TaxID=2856 RepID=A0AAD2PX62_9STRA|nr:unnamed protein product [Cylindrotheca closterium]